MADVVIGTRKMVLKLGTPSVDYTDEVSSVVIAAGDSDSDFVSFAQALSGGARQYTLKMKIRQNIDSSSLWYQAWDNAGDDVAVELWPNGGTTESASTPKITGTVTIKEPDGDFLGGDAKASSTAVNTIEVEWQFTAKPVIDITA